MRNPDEILAFGRRFHAGVRFEPNTDVLVDDADRAIVVRVEIAGADSESLVVEIDDVDLVIRGRRAEHGMSPTASLVRKEIQYGEFATRIALPIPVCDADATAVYRDGILEIRLPIAPTKSYPIVRTEIRMTVRRTHV